MIEMQWLDSLKKRFAGPQNKQNLCHAQSFCNSCPHNSNDVKWVPCSARFALVGVHARGTGAVQVYSLNHGKLETMVESEKQHGFKCCTFAASSLEERHLATGDYQVCTLLACFVPLFASTRPVRKFVSVR
jgi:hypothetical protein